MTSCIAVTMWVFCGFCFGVFLVFSYFLILFTFNSKYECKTSDKKVPRKELLSLLFSTLPVEDFDKLVFWIISQNIKSKRQR